MDIFYDDCYNELNNISNQDYYGFLLETHKERTNNLLNKITNYLTNQNIEITLRPDDLLENLKHLIIMKNIYKYKNIYITCLKIYQK